MPRLSESKRQPDFVYTWDQLLDGAEHTVNVVHDGWRGSLVSLRAKAYREASDRVLTVSTYTISPTEIVIQARNPWTRRHPMWAFTQAQLTGIPFPECTCGAEEKDEQHLGWCGGPDPASAAGIRQLPAVSDGSRSQLSEPPPEPVT